MSKKREDERHIQRMADMLRQGATLTELPCPVCASPLFRLRSGEFWCTKCEKKVIVVREGEEPPKIRNTMILDTLEETILAKIQKIQSKIQDEDNMEELERLGKVLSGLLENLERVQKTKKA